MKEIVLGVGEIGVAGPDEALKTFALGSCVSLVLFCRKTKKIGMAHIALPEAVINQAKSRELPGYFADTGIKELFTRMDFNGASLKRTDYEVKMVGGAQIMDSQGTFNIGKRNVLAIKKLLWAEGLAPIAEEVGGTLSRTVTVYGGTGVVKVMSHGYEDRFI